MELFQKRVYLHPRNKNTLIVSPTIRNVLAGFFLILFAFTITPKKVWHNLVADHTDGRGVTNKDTTQNPSDEQLSRAVFNCQCDNPLTESPFFEAQPAFTTILPETNREYREKMFLHLVSPQSISFGLRGPPLV